MGEVYLLLGGNQGDREAYLDGAWHRLVSAVGNITGTSGLYETAAWGFTDQPAFLNQVLVVQTELAPLDVLARIQEVEGHMGRIRKEKWGPRVVDIDILFCGQQVLDTEKLTIPHPQLHLRRFTLMPLAELAPSLWHPVLGQTVADLLAACPDPLPVTRYPATP